MSDRLVSEDLVIQLPQRLPQDSFHFTWKDSDKENIRMTLESLFPAKTPEQHQQMIDDLRFYSYRMRIIRTDNIDIIPVNNLRSITREIYLSDDFSPKTIRRLMDTAKESMTLAGWQSDLSPMKGKEEEITWGVGFRPGIWEGALELQFYAKKPSFLSEGIFTEPDASGITLADRIGDRIPFWTIRFTPDSFEQSHKRALIGGTQRIATELSMTPIKSLKLEFQQMSRYWDKLPDDISLKNRIIHYFREYKTDRLRGYKEFHFAELWERTAYLYHGLPGQYVINQLERAHKLPIEEITLLLGSKILQGLGFTEIRAVGEQYNLSLAKHQRTDKMKEQFSYSKLFSTYFRTDPNPEDVKFPYYLR